MQELKNQPIRFYTVGNIPTSQGLEVGTGDPYQVQLKAVDAYTDYTNWVQNGDFTSATGWTLNSGLAGISITTTSGGSIGGGPAQGAETASNSYRLLAERNYRIIVDVETCVGGYMTVMGSLDYRIDNAGTHTFYYYDPTPGNYTQFSLYFATDGTYKVNEVKVEDVTDNYSHLLYLANTSGTHVGTLTSSVVTQDFVTYDADVDTIGSVGNKYNIQLLDPVENTNSQNFLHNGYMTNDLNSSDVGWTYSFGAGSTLAIAQQSSYNYRHCMVYTATSSAGAETVTLSGAFKVGVEYEISVTIDAISNCEFVFSCGSATSSTYTSSGTQTATLTCATDTDFDLIFTRTAGTASVYISAITITVTTESDYEPDYESNWFNYLSDSTCDSLAVRALCENNNLGLGFEEDSGFVPFVRIKGWLIEPEYNNDAEQYVGADGVKHTYFFESRKGKKFVTKIYHEYIHDFLRLLGGFDNVYIDSEEYAMEDGNYRLDTLSRDYGSAEFKVGLKEQNTVATNKSISSVGIDITASGSNLIDPNGDFIVDPNGDFVIIP